MKKIANKILACETGSRAVLLGMPGVKRDGILTGLGKG